MTSSTSTTGDIRVLLKRALDLSIAIPLLFVSSPILIVVALLVKCTSRGPILYAATRVGRGGTEFKMYKFRTMRTGPCEGPAVTQAGDPRITAVGRYLRRTKLDELPQLINVLKGDMGLVGPRPEDPRFVARYSNAERRLLSIRPGMTGVGSLRYRTEEEILLGTFDEVEERYVQLVLPQKLALELDYLDSASLGTDIRLLVRTLRAVIFRTGRT